MNGTVVALTCLSQYTTKHHAISSKKIKRWSDYNCNWKTEKQNA